MSETSSRTLTSSLSKLNVSSPGKTIPKPKKAVEEPAESWEDEAVSESDSTLNTPSSPRANSKRPSITRITSTEPPIAPPPTPASPSFSSRTTVSGAPFQTFPPFGMGSTFDAIPEDRDLRKGGGAGDDRRPEKSTAVASRLIAAGIGQAAPKRTAEQREYDRALKVQEKKKRDQAKEEEVRRQREKEEALKAVWED